MSEIFFISDTHFLHNNILRFTDDKGNRIRPEFESLRQMDEHMIRQWNSVVSPQDKVYHLGDVTFQYNGLFNEIMSQLNGHKRLIVGNHDRLMNPNLTRWFEKVDLWTGGKFKHKGFIATHIPLRDDQFRHGEYNVHGHIHEKKSPSDRHICVCVEQVNYTPVHIDDLFKR